MKFHKQEPVLILDTKRCKRNIQRMVKRANESDCIFRPHFKTHQSQKIGQWFRDQGVSGITVSSTAMGLYFAEDGWNDITIAFPFYHAQLPALQKLEQKCRLRLFINSSSDLEFLNQNLLNSFDFVIEIDPGYGRSGIHFENIEQIERLIQTSKKLEKPEFHGFYVHEGRTYAAHGTQQIQDTSNPTIEILKNLKSRFPKSSISIGDTPSASVSDKLHEVDEMTPGNFVFYDYMQVDIGSCTLDDVALFVVLPVAQKFQNAGRAILHGGAVHLSKEFIIKNGNKTFGQVISYSSKSDISEYNGSYLSALSQEHGTLTGLQPSMDDHIWVCPIHSCLTANLFDKYVTTDGEIISKRILS